MEAAEILTTGWCPNDCRYCYIPKSEVMKELHQEITADLKSGKYIERLKKLYGNDLKSLAFWGTEPTLTLDLIRPMLPQVARAFPKLEDISFSTSMIDFKPIVRFVEALHGIKLKVQVSLDGPAYITDKNRFPGAAKRVPQNFFNLVSAIQNQRGEATLLPPITSLGLVNTKVEFHWKATLTIENIKEMNDDPSKIDEYYSYFEGLNKEFDKINHSENITLQKGSYTPTLEVPGSYTSEDGRTFAQFLKNLRQKKHRSVYSNRMGKLLDFWDELGIKRRMFTCSAGDSNSGVSNKLHVCHRSFYLDEDKYVDSVTKSAKNWDVLHFDAGSADMVRKYYIVGIDQDAELARFYYVMRNYHDFWQLQMSYVKGMVMELAMAGQASREYLKNDELSTLFALFVNTSLDCPMENLLNTGSIHLTLLSMLRMFGNGAFQELLHDIPRRKR